MRGVKFFLILIFGLFATSVYGQINVKDSIQNLLNTDTTADFRFARAGVVLTLHASPEEAETLGMSLLYPFVQKHWNNQSDRLSRLARINVWIGLCYRERGGDNRDERERYFYEKGLEIARKSDDALITAWVYTVCAFMEIKRGDIARAHEHLYQAIVHYDKVEFYAQSLEMLGVIGTNFINIKDTDGMYRVMKQMETYFTKIDFSKLTFPKQPFYHHNVFKHHYFDLLAQRSPCAELIDSVFLYIRKNIDLVENHLEKLSNHWMQSYAYYYLAKAFDDYFPEKTDSILFYLDKAFKLFELQETVRQREANSAMEFKIMANIVRANALSRKGRTQEAYRTMNEALHLLDILHHYQNLDEHRYRVYQFLADYYERTNNLPKALLFQKRLRESEARRYETERMRALNEMSARFEAEKKEIQIQQLISEKKAVQRILWLILGLTFMLLLTLFLVIFSSRLMRKNVEQRLYETALQSELHQNELEKVQKLQEQLKQNPVKNSVENIAQMVSDSLIDKDLRTTYLERLSKIDVNLLEQTYQVSKVKITGMDMKYIICFLAEIDVKDISLLFNIEPASVHSVRYRIKKKFSKEDAFRVVL